MISRQQFFQLHKMFINAVKSGKPSVLKQCSAKLADVLKANKSTPIPSMSKSKLYQFAKSKGLSDKQIAIIMHIIKTIFVTIPTGVLFLYSLKQHPVYCAYILISILIIYSKLYGTNPLQTTLIIAKGIINLFTKKKYTKEVKDFIITFFSVAVLYNVIPMFTGGSIPFVIFVSMFYLLTIHIFLAAQSMYAQQMQESYMYIDYINTLFEGV